MSVINDIIYIFWQYLRKEDERIMKGNYHLHVDATVLPSSLHEQLLKAGFTDTNFSGHPEGYRHFEPNYHLTWKASTSVDLKTLWIQADHLLTGEPQYAGYIEGEFIRQRLVLNDQPKEANIAVPFRVSRRRLDAARGEQFRQAELHLVLDKETSSPRLINSLLAAGLYGAYVPKQGWTAVVLTAQGYAHDVYELHAALVEWLPKRGGYMHASLKEEVAIRHGLFNISIDNLPEVIDTIDWK